jgi:hypothetical protein
VIRGVDISPRSQKFCMSNIDIVYWDSNREDEEATLRD